MVLAGTTSHTPPGLKAKSPPAEAEGQKLKVRAQNLYSRLSTFPAASIASDIDVDKSLSRVEANAS